MESRKMVLRTNLQGFNADEDMENGSVDTVREGDGGRN